MRRARSQDPPASTALWCRRIATVGAVVSLAALAGSHAGAVRPAAAVAVLEAGLALEAVAVLLAAAAAVSIWRTGAPGAGAAVAGLALAATVAAGPATTAALAWRLPALHDVSTDREDPPAFADSRAALAARAGDEHAPIPPADLAVQAAAYPDLQPATLDLTPAAAYAAALKLVRRRHWRILATRAPAPGAPGRIDAVARTRVMALREDVVIRLAAAGSGTRVDLRSAARMPGGDGGTNAARIVAFLDELQDATGGE